MNSYATSKHTVLWFFFKGLKCRSQDEKNNDKFTEVAKTCLSNMSSWDSPSVNNNNNNNKDYNSGRHNENRRQNNRDSYDGNADNNHESTRNTNGGNDNDYGMWRKQQNSGGKFVISKAFDSI